MTPLQRPKPRPGVFDRRFWEFVNQRELRLQQCIDCGHWRYPPAPVCPRCLSSRTEWRPLSGRGTVVAWTVFHRQYFPQLPIPYAVLSVEVEEGPLMIGNLAGADIHSLRHGMAVKAVFEEAASPDGPWAIVQWTPA
jgi:uncharacterized OB-fold protein